jgi:alkanesulfonate monooxygenase SsuD/methylene tetrahydromethanopterin reductase-like flavin-dependent oxidoreductase (luciferase family)
MRVGIYLDMRNPPAWRRPWADVYGGTLELVDQAETWGADSVWTTEHHLFEDGYLPQPLTFAAALAVRTRRMRIGTAVLLAPLRPAVQIVEDAALVDILSDGRLDLGLGAGYRAAEFTAYGADLRGRIRTHDERATQVMALQAGGQVTPPPVQQPLPVFMGYLGPKGARRAGRMGTGLLALVPGSVEPYLAGLAEGGHDLSTARLAGLVHVLVADDPEQAWAQVGPHVAYQLHSYARYALEGTGIAVPPPPEPGDVRAAGLASAAPGIFPNFVVLTPDDTVDLLAELAPTDIASEAFFFASIAGMPTDLATRHVELLCTKVRPAVGDL